LIELIGLIKLIEFVELIGLIAGSSEHIAWEAWRLESLDAEF